MAENKFKVGDKIIGNGKGDRYYTVTRKGWIGVVVNIPSSEHIYAKPIDGDRVYDNLVSSCFDLYDDERGECISLW